MQIKKIELENFRGFKKQTIELLPNINVFVGVNGAGKSTILDAIAISMSWLVERIQKEEAQGMEIPEDSIKNGAEFSSITLAVEENNKEYNWEKIEFKRGYPADKQSDFNKLNKLAYFYQTKYQETESLPVVAYYPINRIAKGIAGLDIYGRESIAQLDVYDNALGSKANFQAFFEWFRLQDDIINEQAQSRSKWMQKNKRWIRLRLSRIFKNLDSFSNNKQFKFMKERLLHDSLFLEEPRFLFYELIETIEKYTIEDEKYIAHDIEHLLHRMSRLFDRVDDEIVEVNNYLFKDMTKIIEHIFYLNRKISTKNFKVNLNILQFIWEVFLFSTQLTFWRLSQKGREDLAHIFKYSNTIGKKNQLVNIENFIAQIKNVLEKDYKRLKDALYNQGRELEIVTKTIEKFIPEYSNLRVTRIPRPHMLVEKNGETISLNQLSDGEKNMIAMIGDIARRLSMANPTMQNPLEGDGIVMIDEIDLHLHPLWQRVIVSKLTEVFPKCQFIISTHSPQVLSHVRAEHIFILEPKKDNVSISTPTESYGKSTDRQLEDILGVASRPIEIKNDLRNLYVLIQKQELNEAKQLLKKLGQDIEGSEPELVKADVLIKRKEILGK